MRTILIIRLAFLEFFHTLSAIKFMNLSLLEAYVL